MNTILFCFLTILLVACSRNDETEVILNPSDVAAVAGMAEESNNILAAIAELEAATTSEEIHYWDSTYKHHDSLYWHHHSEYNSANGHPHNDHHHEWTHYDTGTDHSHHYHHPYPEHVNDSLVVISNDHHPNVNIHHPDIHGLHDHHVMDSLDLVYEGIHH
jgi:hypothetical protein